MADKNIKIPVTQESEKINERLRFLCGDELLKFIAKLNANTTESKVVIAGGIVNLARDTTLDIMLPAYNKSDIDIFVMGPNHYKLDILCKFLNEFDAGNNTTYVGTHGSVVYLWSVKLERHVQLVFMTEKYKNPFDIINGFDMTHIMCAYDGHNYYVSVYSDIALQSRNTYYLPNSICEDMRSLRIFKACSRNYNVYEWTDNSRQHSNLVQFNIMKHLIKNMHVYNYMTMSYKPHASLIAEYSCGQTDVPLLSWQKKIVNYYINNSTATHVYPYDKNDIPAFTNIIKSINFNGINNIDTSYYPHCPNEKKPVDDDIGTCQKNPDTNDTITRSSHIPLSEQKQIDKQIVYISSTNNNKPRVHPGKEIIIKLEKREWYYEPYMHRLVFTLTPIEYKKIKLIWGIDKFLLTDNYETYTGKYIYHVYDKKGIFESLSGPQHIYIKHNGYNDEYTTEHGQNQYSRCNYLFAVADEVYDNAHEQNVTSLDTNTQDDATGQPLSQSSYYIKSAPLAISLNISPALFTDLWTNNNLVQNTNGHALGQENEYCLGTDYKSLVFTIKRDIYKLIKHDSIILIDVELTDNEYENINFIYERMVDVNKTRTYDVVERDNSRLFIDKDGTKRCHIVSLYGITRKELELCFNNYNNLFNVRVSPRHHYVYDIDQPQIIEVN